MSGLPGLSAPTEVVEWKPSRAIPRGMCVIVGAGGVVVWMGPANQFPAELGLWPGPITVNVDERLFEIVKQAAHKREKGVPYAPPTRP